jgi:hypothetical protein
MNDTIRLLLFQRSQIFELKYGVNNKRCHQIKETKDLQFLAMKSRIVKWGKEE